MCVLSRESMAWQHSMAPHECLQQWGLLELDVYIADHVICQVITDVQMLYLSKFVHLLKDVLIEVLSTKGPSSG